MPIINTSSTSILAVVMTTLSRKLRSLSLGSKSAGNFFVECFFIERVSSKLFVTIIA